MVDKKELKELVKGGFEAAAEVAAGVEPTPPEDENVKAAKLMQEGLTLTPEELERNIDGLDAGIWRRVVKDKYRPGGVRRTAGDGQRAPRKTPVPVPPEVQVTDANGDSIPGMGIKFTVVAGDGRVAHRLVFTDKNGRASAHWILGDKAGPNRLKAEAADLTVEFEADAT